jgi:hypothetical protein
MEERGPTEPDYTLVSGAKKNVGDFLIYERAKRLLENHLGTDKFLTINRWEKATHLLNEINASKAVIICGGPGYSHNFFPDVYTFLLDFDKIKVPVIPLGLGWIGRPMYHPDDFSFTDESIRMIKKIRDRCGMSSCRDVLTEKILKRYGLENVTMTGCPVWYELDHIGKPFIPPDGIKQITISLPPNPVYFSQTLYLARETKRVFPEANITCAFHRGIDKDEHTPKGKGQALQKLRNRLEGSGFSCTDTSYDTSKIEYYKNCDLHVGYRVHAHIYFLSIRKPTFLISVDGRGMGVSKTLGTEDVPACSESSANMIDRLRYFPGVGSMSGAILTSGKPVDRLLQIINKQKQEGFVAFKTVTNSIDDHYKVMSDFIKKIPR